MPSLLTSVAAAELMPKNTLRKSLIISNEDTTDAVFIKFERSENTTVSATVHDHRIGPGGLLALNFGTDGLAQVQSRITIIAAANTPRVSWFETEDIQR